jgi:hypothetical protein
MFFNISIVVLFALLFSSCDERNGCVWTYPREYSENPQYYRGTSQIFIDRSVDVEYYQHQTQNYSDYNYNNYRSYNRNYYNSGFRPYIYPSYNFITPRRNYYSQPVHRPPPHYRPVRRPIYHPPLICPPGTRPVRHHR